MTLLSKKWDESLLFEFVLSEEWQVTLGESEEEEGLIASYNAEFERLYKKARQEELGQPQRSVSSLVDLCVPIVGSNLTSETLDIMPEELIAKVQHYVPKAKQIALFQMYREWFKNDDSEEGDGEGVEKWRLKYECMYNKRGQKHGLCRRWYFTGALWEEKFYEHGRKAGTRMQYSLSGRKILESQYHEGKLEGIARWWYEDGQLKKEQNYYNGMKNGRGIVYREDGSLWKIVHYRNDLKHGFCKSFAPDGSLLQNVAYQNGKKKKLSDSLTTSWPCMPHFDVPSAPFVVTS
jgi:hypothetical protein